MKQLRLLTKIYVNKKETLAHFRQVILEELRDLSVTINAINYDSSGFIILTLEGEDEIAASNYLETLFGRSIPFAEIKEGQTLRGYICSSGKVGFGLFIDIGI